MIQSASISGQGGKLNSLGEAIQAIRRQRDESMRQFAAALGVSQPTVSRWEADKFLPDGLQLLTLHAMAADGEARQWITSALKGRIAQHGSSTEEAQPPDDAARFKQQMEVVMASSTSQPAAVRRDLFESVLRLSGKRGVIPRSVVRLIDQLADVEIDAELMVEIDEAVVALERLVAAKKKGGRSPW